MMSMKFELIPVFRVKSNMTSSRATIVENFLRQNNLLVPSEKLTFSRLEGGVSSDIWHVSTENGPICIKAALPKLNVNDDWFAPVERNGFEVLWIRKANAICPGLAPNIIADDRENGLFAMTFYPPEINPTWKSQLRDGVINIKIAARIGEQIAKIHSFTENEPDSKNCFKTDSIFHAIRLEPYLEAAAKKHPDLAKILTTLSSSTAKTRRALVHGDVSPKNILAGSDGPILIDAECAWYGDPAFDLAFCLNHLLLKCVWKPQFKDGYQACFEALVTAYNQAYTGSDLLIEQRAAHLLPGLLLGRVDGRSPAEYIKSDHDKNFIRMFASRVLKNPFSELADVGEHWHKSLPG